jgi:hypothetical protein
MLPEEYAYRHMKLPLDANGMPVHVGDSMMLANVDHDEELIVIAVSENDFYVGRQNLQGEEVIVRHSAKTFKHRLTERDRALVTYLAKTMMDYAKSTGNTAMEELIKSRFATVCGTELEE